MDRTPLKMGVHRADLVAVLAAALPAEVVHTGRRCTQFIQHDGSASVMFDTREVIEADAVIAADESIRSYSSMSSSEPSPSSPALSHIAASSPLPECPAGRNVLWCGEETASTCSRLRAGQQINFVGFVPADTRMRES
jgi:salicylate hydroxylase